MQTTYEMIHAHAAAQPERLLFAYRTATGWTRVTRAAGLEQAARLAGGLSRLGVRSDDRVVILAENRWEWMAVPHQLRHPRLRGLRHHRMLAYRFGL